IAIGNLIGREERTILLRLKVPPLPLDAEKGNTPAAEKPLLHLEIRYNSVQPERLHFHRWEKTIGIQPIANGEEQRTHPEVVGLVAMQHARQAMEAALREAEIGQIEQAKELLRVALAHLKSLPPSEDAATGIHLLETYLHQLEVRGEWSARERKSAHYH